MKKLFIRIKYFFEKNALSLGVIVLLICAFFVWFWKPAMFYKQHTGVVENIVQSTYSVRLCRMNNPITLDIYIFFIEGKEYHITKVDNKSYDFLIGKTINIRSSQSIFEEAFFIEEIIYNGIIVYSVSECIGRFFRWLIYFTLCLCWVVWGFIKQWKSNEKPIKAKNENEDEFFFDNWGITKHNEKCFLTYISKLDNNVIHIRITEEEFLSVKERKIGLDDFSSKYNLW